MLGSAMLREGSWSRSNFFWGTSPFKPPNGTLGASNEFDQQSMTALASSPILELGATVMEEWPTIHQMASFQLRSSSSLFSSFWRSAITSFPHFMAWHPRFTSEQAHVWSREQLRPSARTSSPHHLLTIITR